jgi:hypothetical protein
MKINRMTTIIWMMLGFLLAFSAQAAVKPHSDQALPMLKEGNLHFVEGKPIHPHTGKHLLYQANTQHMEMRLSWPMTRRCRSCVPTG